ncbi:MAG: SMC-Scp complex subunit ScpB [Clostridia bacterium]|nr:SMC-Scp complex subunit ScpB [Clostridia bacterium]
MEQYVGDNIYSKNEATAEALLFASGGVVEPESICLVLKVKKDEAEEVMKRLMARYERRKGGIIIRKVGDGWQLSSNPDYYDDLCVYFQETATGNLSRAAMETLTIIAYNQPVTRAGIEMVRGVNSDGVLAKLVERGLVEERGKADSPGRPILYGTTDMFLKSIGISDLSELPDITLADDNAGDKVVESSNDSADSNAEQE